MKYENVTSKENGSTKIVLIGVTQVFSQNYASWEIQRLFEPLSSEIFEVRQGSN